MKEEVLSSQVMLYMLPISVSCYTVFSLHATKIWRYNVGNCPLHKGCGEDAGAGGHAAELLEGVWRDSGAKKAELPK